MKTIIIALICLAVGFGAAFMFFSDGPIEQTVAAADDVQLYTCGMHPEVISKEPGNCPICHMKLTPVRKAGADQGTIRIDPSTKQNMGLVTHEVSHQTLTGSISTFGKVQVPDPNMFSVTIKFDGWVEKLFVSEKGEQVFMGQPLLEIYSPELVAAQEELLVALKSESQSSSVKNLLKSAEQRLRNWDISDDQLSTLKETGAVTRTMTIRSPASGFVKAKNVNQGDRLSAHSVLYEIVDLSRVWVQAFVYEQDLPYIKLKQNAVVSTPGLPGKKFNGQVVYISPLLDSKSQTEIRIVLDNPNFTLKPEMYADVAIESILAGERLTVPRSAVINSGMRQVVFVALSDDSYEPRIVTTGVIGKNDLVEITAGLKAGEQVVVSGQFLLDSESRLNEALKSGEAMPSTHQHGGSSKDMDISKAGEKMPPMQQHTGDKKEVGTSMTQPMETHSEMKKDDPYDIHTCPMPVHFHVLNYGPGQCPDCGMDLVPLAETDNAPVYVCPMPQCKTATKEPGTCPVCNMNLVKYTPENKNAK